jgi:hypothetical protein
MDDRRPCTLRWCEASHRGDTPAVAHHHRLLGEETGNGTSVTVLARWAERHDGRNVLPHLTIHAVTETEALDIDVMPREAAIWSAIVSSVNSRWLAAMLTAGAVTLAPHDDQEHEGEPHYVVENAPQRTDKAKFSWALICEVFDVLHRHGYRQGDDQHTGRAIGLLGDLVKVFEGGEDR